jgi:hypothetical protein
MKAVLFALLLLSAVMILFGHFIMSMIDRFCIYPRRLAKVQSEVTVYPPARNRPCNLPPAIVSQLVFFDGHNRATGKSYTRFTVTLLDLIHRKKIFVTHRAEELFFSPLGDESDLLPFEHTVLQFLKDAAGERIFISLSDLLVYIESHREMSAAMRSQFLGEVADDFISRELSGEVSFEKKLHPLMSMGEVAVVCTAGLTIGWLAGNAALGLISVGLAAVAFSLCLQVFRYKLLFLTSEGLEQKAQWLAYGAHLAQLNPDNCKAVSESELCDYAVYAVAFEQEKTFTSLAPLWRDIAEDHPECILYEPLFFKKLIQIDSSILISNVNPGSQAEIQQIIKKGHG